MEDDDQTDPAQAGGESDPPCAPPDETRMEIWTDGPMKYWPSAVQRQLGTFLRQNYGGAWINYSDAPADRKAFWFAHFKRTYFYPPHRAARIEGQFSAVAAKLIRDAIDDQKRRDRSGGPIQGWITPEQWTTMKARFSERSYQERSEKAKVARSSAGKWCSGSIPMTEHFRRLIKRVRTRTW
ncbi:required to maintain repression 7 [Iris pallida]|uniref:Required to maintain repression 7 n=1 Tax=Iris pallida TaxID=29817 RepID=A0AAX6FFM2_IRIPA|nr:required to maintain repression 7 [Iris pallida]